MGLSRVGLDLVAYSKEKRKRKGRWEERDGKIISPEIRLMINLDS